MKTTEPLSDAEYADWILTPEAVRTQSESLFNAALEGDLKHFTLNLDQLDQAADYTCATIAENYPDLAIPPHARWRHFAIDGIDQWRAVADILPDDPIARAKIECELAITSVLLDAGAGATWRYVDKATGKTLSRSEGLAIASLNLFQAGGFSSNKDAPLSADAEGLAAFSKDQLQAGFQISSDNPLAGVDGRVQLINALGAMVSDMPGVFGKEAPRLGNLADFLFTQAEGDKLDASVIVVTLLHTIGRIWEGRLSLAGRNLGDTWSHPALPERNDSAGLIPFHKLSQWLAYSLIEPLNRAGLTVHSVDKLTGLAEYRNGGLFVDCGVIVPRSSALLEKELAPSHPAIVEWRALTIILLDHIADTIRIRLDKSPEALPLASVLEGGTWAAGRKIAREKRTHGGPPIMIESDGTVF